MEFLGNTVDTIRLTLEVSQDRITELDGLLDKWSSKKVYTKREIQSLIGKLSFITNCVHPGRIFLSRLIESMKNCGERELKKVKHEMLKDIKWWKAFLPDFKGETMLWLYDTIETDTWLASDASLVGGRGHTRNW